MIKLTPLALIFVIFLGCKQEVNKMTKLEIINYFSKLADSKEYYSRLNQCPRDYSGKQAKLNFSSEIEEVCFAVKGPIGWFAKDVEDWTKDHFTLNIPWRTDYGASDVRYVDKSNSKMWVVAFYVPIYDDRTSELKSFGLNPPDYVGYAKFYALEE